MLPSGRLTDAIWLLQLVISSPLIHALGDPSQAPTGIRTIDVVYYSPLYLSSLTLIWKKIETYQLSYPPLNIDSL